MLKRIDQQIFVTKTMIDFGSPLKYSKELKTYLLHYLAIMISICNILLKLENTKENKAKRKDVWQYLKKYDKKLYQKIRFQSFATITCLPRCFEIPVYKIDQKIYKFN